MKKEEGNGFTFVILITIQRIFLMNRTAKRRNTIVGDFNNELMKENIYSIEWISIVSHILDYQQDNWCFSNSHEIEDHYYEYRKSPKEGTNHQQESSRLQSTLTIS